MHHQLPDERKHTKKGIRKTERWLAAQINTYVASLHNGNPDAENKRSQNICLALTCLLSGYLEIGSNWPNKQRWLDGIVNGYSLLKDSDTLILWGKMIWGLAENPGGEQWEEPFEAVIWIPKKRNRVKSYILKFGKEVSANLIESGVSEVHNVKDRPGGCQIIRVNPLCRICLGSDWSPANPVRSAVTHTHNLFIRLVEGQFTQNSVHPPGQRQKKESTIMNFAKRTGSAMKISARSVFDWMYEYGPAIFQ